MRSLYNEKYKIIYVDNYLAGRELDLKDLESIDLSLFEFLKVAGLVEIFQSKTRTTINSAIDYLTGLLVLTHDRNMSKIEEETRCQTTAHSFSYFLTKGIWSSEYLCKLLRKFILTLVDRASLVFTLDESAVAKSGKNSVGAARQYCGNMGKVELCQVGVYLGIQLGNIRLILDYRLYLPQSIIDDVTNIEKFGIPKDKFIFKKKQELALEMIDSLISEGINITKIVMDGFYGSDSFFLSQLSKRNIIFLADIACNTQICLENPITYLPKRKGSRGRNPSIFKILTQQFKVSDLVSDPLGWLEIKVRPTERGYKNVFVKCFRVWRKEDGLPVSDPLWLIISYDCSEKKVKYSFSNLPESVSEKELAIFQSSRYWIERTFEDMKGMYGLSDLQGRSWNSWHRHVVLVMVCATFISQKTMNLKENGIAIRITSTLELFRQLNPLIKKELFEVIYGINKKIKAALQSRNSRLKNAIS